MGLSFLEEGGDALVGIPRGHEPVEVARVSHRVADARLRELGVIPGVADADLNLAVVDRDDPPAAAARLISSLESSDAHWYAAATFWIMQLAASLIRDPRLAATLLGVAAAHYDAEDKQQPHFIAADLEATRALLKANLGAEAFVAAYDEGTGLSQTDAIAAAKDALTDLAGS